MHEDDMLMTPSTAIILIIIVVGVVLLVTFLSDPAKFREGRANIFFICLAGFSVLIIWFYYYTLITVFAKQEQMSIRQETNQIGLQTTDSLSKSMLQTTTLDPDFVFSVNPLLPQDEQALASVSKGVLSYNIFNIWRTTLTSSEFNKESTLPYVTRYVQQANSSQLKVYWDLFKIDFNSDTQTFGDLLFKYGLPVDRKTPRCFVRAAKKVINDPKFQNLPCV